MKLSKLRVVYRPLSWFVPYERRLRIHPDVAELVTLIQEYGFKVPVLARSDGTVVDGEFRIQAATVLEFDRLPVILCDEWTPHQVRGFRLAVNKLPEWTEWNLPELRVEFAELEVAEFDLHLTGFHDDEIQELLAPIETDGLTDEDVAPPAPKKPVSRLGDLWQLGPHRVLCGDSTSKKDVDRLMNGTAADMVFTDPPYGMSYGGGRAAGSTRKGARVKAHGMILGDEKRGDELIDMVREALTRCTEALKDQAAVYVCFTWRTYSEFEAALEACGLKPAACIVWDKGSIGLGNSHYRPQHEFIFFCHEFIFYCKGKRWKGGKAESDVWKMRREVLGDYVHPTQKPVELVERAIRNSSIAGDVVLDVFGGSGSTLIACEKTVRGARLMELDPKYVDVEVQRWQDFTGEKGRLEGTKRTFGQVARSRRQ